LFILYKLFLDHHGAKLLVMTKIPKKNIEFKGFFIQYSHYLTDGYVAYLLCYGGCFYNTKFHNESR